MIEPHWHCAMCGVSIERVTRSISGTGIIGSKPLCDGECAERYHRELSMIVDESRNAHLSYHLRPGFDEERRKYLALRGDDSNGA
jgi:hypothetical protein